ncbi:metallophosphoesterase [Deltaproteobacteria bacterium]|nr:metallophosphoesterase [Deltaproteobacteria bacterium]
MRALFTSDIHASDSHLYSMITTAEKEAINCVIIGGDIIPHYLYDTARFGMLKAQARYLENIFIPTVKDFKNRSDISIYFDLGNDDFIYNRKILERYNGELFNLIHLAKHELTDDVDIIGYMNVPPTPFKIKDWEKPDSADIPYIPENKISINGYISANGLLEEAVIGSTYDDTIEEDLNRLSKIIDRQFIFISHSPPYKSTLDVIHSGQNVGSISIRRFIEKWSEKGLLLASFHGHIHESPQRSGFTRTKIANSLCVNPGQGNGKGAEFRYVIFDLDKNHVFVSRG